MFENNLYLVGRSGWSKHIVILFTLLQNEGKKYLKSFKKDIMQEFVDHVAVLFKPGDRLDIQKWRPSVTLVVERETDKGIFFSKCEWKKLYCNISNDIVIISRAALNQIDILI